MNPDRTRPDKTHGGAEYRYCCKSYRRSLGDLSVSVLWKFVAQTQVVLSTPRNAKGSPLLEARLDVATDLLIDRLGPAEWVPARER